MPKIIINVSTVLPGGYIFVLNILLDWPSTKPVRLIWSKKLSFFNKSFLLGKYKGIEIAEIEFKELSFIDTTSCLSLVKSLFSN